MAVVCVLVAACGGSPPQSAPQADPPAARARALADAYLDGFLARNPDQVPLFGVPGRRHDKLPDNSMDALRTWQAKEDAWLKEAQQIDPAAIDPPTLRATYAIVREALEGAIGARECRSEARNGIQVRHQGVHDRVLADGAVPVSFLHDKIRAWSGAKP